MLRCFVWPQYRLGGPTVDQMSILKRFLTFDEKGDPRQLDKIEIATRQVCNKA